MEYCFLRRHTSRLPSWWINTWEISVFTWVCVDLMSEQHMQWVWHWGPKQMNQGWIKLEILGNTSDFSLSHCVCLFYTHKHIDLSKLQLHSNLCVPLLSVLLKAQIGPQYTIWTISLLERLNNVLTVRGKTLWLRVTPLFNCYCLSELGGQGNQNGSMGDEKMDALSCHALNLMTLCKKKVCNDLPLHPSLPLSWPVCHWSCHPKWDAWLWRRVRAGRAGTNQCHHCQGASQMTRAPGD